MQKQLITDQLIKVSQDRIEAKRDYLKFQLSDAQRKTILNDIDNIEIFIKQLQSLRQQEVQNVIDAYHTARIDSISHDWYPEKHAKEYFTQTFEQKGGGNDELRKP